MSCKSRRAVFLLASLGLLAACATGSRLQQFDEPGRVWPEPPEAMRIAFVGEFSTSADLGIRATFWERVVSFAAGGRSDELQRPMAVVSNSDSSVIFVADPDAQCIHRYDLAQGRYRCLTSGRGEPPVAPVGLAITDDGDLFATDSSTGRLMQVSSDGKKLEQFFVASLLEQPTGIHWDNQSELLYVTDTKKHSIFIFDRDGNLKNEIGERGNQPGQFNFPTYIWSDKNGELIVTDSLNFRVQRLTNKGHFVQAFGENGDKPGDFSRPKGVAVDSFGHIYVVDALMHLVQVFSRDGELLLVLGEQGQGEGQFWLPNGIYITRENLIFVADSYNKRVQVFRYVGSGS